MYTSYNALTMNLFVAVIGKQGTLTPVHVVTPTCLQTPGQTGPKAKIEPGVSPSIGGPTAGIGDNNKNDVGTTPNGRPGKKIQTVLANSALTSTAFIHIINISQLHIYTVNFDLYVECYP